MAKEYLNNDDFYAIIRLLETFTHPYVTELQSKLSDLRVATYGNSFNISQSVIDKLAEIIK